MVEQMPAARKQLAGEQSDKIDFYTHRCDGLDRQIDALVYDLYALTPAAVPPPTAKVKP